MIAKILLNISIALEAITHNRLRSFLTSLGLIFGVASVISMLSIGKGAQQEIMEQLKILGSNNVIIKPISEQKEEKIVEEKNKKTKEKKRFSPGLSLQDVKAIIETIPHVEYVSPEIIYETLVIRSGLKRSVKLVGVKSEFFRSPEIRLAQGNLFSEQYQNRVAPVCVIGSGIKAKFFPQDNPVGKKIKCGNTWLTVIGVLKKRRLSKKNISKLGIRDYNMDVYAPISTVLLRFKNRSLVTKDDILKNSRQKDKKIQQKNYHQLDRIVVRVEDTAYMASVSDILNRKLKRLHNKVIDYEIILPQSLLEQEQHTKKIFNMVLGAIASISLLIGGIGIMNIMLASVMERIREIGIRMAVGATSKDIVMQFLIEAVILGISGGIIGIIIGYIFSYAIERFSGIITIITPFSIFLSLSVSVSVGLIFGIFPAKKASRQDPIVSLRYE